MSNINQHFQSIKDYIDFQIANLEIATEGIVTEVFKNAKKVRVKPLKSKLDDNGHIMRVALGLSGNKAQVGGLPPVGSKVLIVFLTTDRNERWNNCIALCGLFDSKDVLSPDKDDVTDEAKADQNYYVIQPQKDESKIEIYKDMKREVIKKDSHEVIKNGQKYIDIAGGSNDKRVMIGGQDLSDDYCLVTKKHLDKYDDLLKELDKYVAGFRTMSIIGDLGIPLVFAVRNTGTYESFATPFQTALNGSLVEQGTNKTDCTKSK